MIKGTLKRALGCIGLDVSLLRYWPHLHFSFRSWTQLGLSPGFLIDVGVNRGDWTCIASRYFPRTQFLLVDPQERLQQHSADLLGRPNIRWKTVGFHG